MSITAKQLSKSGAKGKDLDMVVREQLLIIDDRLHRAERTWGRNIVAHELPTNYTLPGLEKKDAQRIIYSTIARNLQERGFAVRLLLENEKTVVYTEWVTDLNSEEVNAMNRLIRAVRITPEEVEAYLGEAPSASRAPAPRAAPSAPSRGGREPPAGGLRAQPAAHAREPGKG